MTILIHTIPADSHAISVQIALENLGFGVQTWFTRDFPSHQTAEFVFDGNKNNAFEISDDSECIKTTTGIEVVWHRRIPKAQCAMPAVEEVDKEFVDSEIRYFMASAIPLIGQDAFWVNDLKNSRYADNKVVQLQAAVKVGLKVPETIVTNNPEKLRRFIRSCSPRKVIYKPLRAYAWRKPETQLITYTSLVSEADLPEDMLIRACPGIYQEYFEKAFEVRVTIMGNHVISAALIAEDKLDWRVSVLKNELKARAYDLPDKLKQKCIMLLRELGLVFGCIDFIVTPDGEHVFLENNEAGQFLWIEQMVPELRVLDPFVQFLVKKNPDFEYIQPRNPVTFSEVVSSEQYETLRLRFESHQLAEPNLG